MVELTKYVVELFPSTPSGRSGCSTGCSHCAFADDDPEGAPLTPTKEMLSTFQEVQARITEEKKRFDLHMSGLATRITSMPATNEHCAEVIFGAGPLSTANMEEVVKAMFSLTTTAPVASGYATSLTVNFSDNAVSLLNKPRLAVSQLQKYVHAYANALIENMYMQLNPSIGISIIGNELPREGFFSAQQRFMEFVATYNLVRQSLRNHPLVMGENYRSKVYSDDKTAHGQNILLSAFSVDQYATEHNPVDRNILFLRTRYVFNPEHGKEPEHIDPASISLYPNRVLIGHSALSIKRPEGWMEYDQFRSAVERAHTEDTPLDKILQAELAK